MAVSGVNPTGLKSRSVGTLAFDDAVPNQDGAGTVDAVGPGVGLSVGQRVWIWEAAWQRPSGEAKAGVALSAGAHHVIHCRAQDAEAAIKTIAPDGVDVIVEVAPAANAALDTAGLAPHGTVAIYANNGGGRVGQAACLTTDSGSATSSSDLPSASMPRNTSTRPPTIMTPAPMR